MENARLDIYVNGSESGQTRSANNNGNQKGVGTTNTQGVFKRPRTRSQSNGMDLLANLKNKLGDDAYSKAYLKVTKKGDADKASKAGSHAQYNARAGVALIAFAAKELVSLGVDMIGVHTSNQAKKNELDNLTSGINYGLSVVGSVGAGAAAGGLAGMLIAIAMEGVKLGFQAIRTVENTNKTNQERAYEVQRKTNRLGYIEAGFSR